MSIFGTTRCGLLLIACAFCLSAVDELPTRIPPDDAKIALQGAWSADFTGAWTGVGFKVRTDATAMNMLMQDHAPGGAHPKGGNKNNYLAIQIDDQVHALALEKGVERYAIPGLDGKAHTVTVFKRTEPLFGDITFKGLELPAGAQLLDPPAPAAIRLQVIGDSISCGYGNEAEGPKSAFKHDTENGFMTYWAIAGRELGADMRCAAKSGHGVYRDRGNKTTFQLPAMWRLAIPSEKNQVAERDGVDWKPTHAVINLGTNDIAKGIPEEEPFLTAYRGLVADLRKDNADCKVFAIFGPMISDKKQGKIHEYLDKLAAEDDKLWVVVLTNPHGIKGAGTHWHPNVLANQTCAEQLLKAINAAE